MGTGPYRFVSHAEDEVFVFERFEDHFPPIDHPVRVRPEVQSQLAGIEAGEIDMLVSLGPDVVGPFVDDPDFSVQFVPAEAWSTQNIYPNLWAETMDDGRHEFWLACETAPRLRQCERPSPPHRARSGARLVSAASITRIEPRSQPWPTTRTSCSTSMARSRRSR